MEQQYNKLQQSVIGSLLLFEKLRPQLMNKLRETDFTDEPAREIFNQIKKMPDAIATVIVTSLTNRQSKVYAVTAAQLSPVSSNAEITVDYFIEQSKQNYLMTQIQAMAFNAVVTVEELKNLVEQVENRGNVNVNSADKYINEFFKDIRKIPTGFKKLDEYLDGGFVESSVVTIGARPSTGKTTFALNITKACIEKDMQVAIFSIEMKTRAIYDRILSDVLSIPYNIVQNHNTLKNDFENIQTVVKELYRNVSVIDEVNNIEKIVSYVYSNKPNVAIVDFTQIVQTSENYIDNRQRIDHISQQFKQCAKKTNCCFICLSQLTRSGKDEPTMSNLKESGGLEQDSDYVILLHRPYVLDKNNDKISPKETKLILDKNKYGNTGIVQFEFDGKFQRFTEIDEDGVARPVNNPNGYEDEDLPF